MIIERAMTPDWLSNTYLVAAGPGGDALLVDAGGPMHELFAAAVEATDEAVVNALFAAETMVGRDGNTLYAMPGDRVLELMEAAGRLGR